jgi:predicted methyltransferase
MSRSTRLASLVAAALALASCATAPPPSAVTGRLDAAIAGAHRPEADRARDRYRHPRETLLFFGLRPNQTVVEIWPAGGWYTRIIAPVLQGSGHYVAAMSPVVAGNANSERNRQAYTDLLAAAPAQLGATQVVDWQIGKGNLVPDGSADLVLTFRNLHNWMAGGVSEAALRDFYRALKPGGTLGVVDHRGNEAVPQDPKAASGYVNQSHAIRLIENAGFRLVATSEINANPKDTKDYEGGVWTLPPNLQLGATDRDKYLAIGESDRFTLKFIKPR